ncbi:MAG TPA: hypothetical protein VII56_04475 [Rhizomicrobium sp.]
METGRPAKTFSLTSTQRGAIGESVVATGLMLASGGQLSPYRPVADDDGVDLLLVDKLSRSIVQLQVKCRTKVDNEKAQTVQFDVQTNTFAEGARGFTLGILLDGAVLQKAWLIPLAQLRTVARQGDDKLVVVASAKQDSQDRYRPFRHGDFESIARVILDGAH